MICPYDDCGLEKPELSGYEPEDNMKLTAGVTDGALYEDGHFIGRMNTHEKAVEIEHAVNLHEALLELVKEAARDGVVHATFFDRAQKAIAQDEGVRP
jgi:hypothetical protein